MSASEPSKQGIRAAVLVAMGLAGCTLHHVPRQTAIESTAIAAFAPSQSVGVAGTETSAENSLPVSPYTVTVSYREYTEAVVRRIKDQLVSHGVAIGEGPKRLNLAVIYVTIVPGAGRFTCFVESRVVMGDGAVRGQQGSATSWDYGASCNAAVSDLVVKILIDPSVRRYLQAPS